MKHKIRILKGTAADFFDHSREVTKQKGHYEPLADQDIISIDIDDDLLKRAVEVFEDEGMAIMWFILPDYALGGQCPGELSKTLDGR